MGRSTKIVRCGSGRNSLRWWNRAGCVSAATGIHAAAFRSTFSGRPANCPRASGPPTRASRHTAGAADSGRALLRPQRAQFADQLLRRIWLDRPGSRGDRHRVGPGSEVVGERLTVLDGAQHPKRDGRAYRHGQQCADASLDLMENERDPQRLADVTGNLEQAAVLAAEPDRDDSGVRTLNELRDERLPARVDRGTAS